MSYEEYWKWKSFRADRPFNITEVQLAVLGHIAASQGGVTADLSDFMITPGAEEIKEVKPLEGKELDMALRGAFG